MTANTKSSRRRKTAYTPGERVFVRVSRPCQLKDGRLVKENDKCYFIVPRSGELPAWAQPVPEARVETGTDPLS